MPSSIYEERLAEHRHATLLPEVGLTRYTHIERLGNEEVEGLLDGECVIQNKIDGTNLTVAWYDEPIGLVIASRNNVVYRNGDFVKFPKKDKDGNPEIGLDGKPKIEIRYVDAVDYVRAHGGIQTLAAMGFILRGEWLIHHSNAYAKEKYGHLYLFDVQWRSTGIYVPADQWMDWAKEHGIPYIPVLARMTNPTVESLLEYVKGPDEFGAAQKEGIVVKRFGFTNKYGRTTWGKLVSADFKEKMHAAMGATNDDPPEIKFASRIVTFDFIMKTIHTLEDSLGRKLVIRDMPQVLGRVYHDAFIEELWDFVQKETVSKFDFRTARKTVENKTRDIALAYFNGVPTVWQH